MFYPFLPPSFGGLFFGSLKSYTVSSLQLLARWHRPSREALKERTGRHLGGEGVVTLTRGSGDAYLIVVPIEMWRAGICLAESQGRLVEADFMSFGPHRRTKQLYNQFPQKEAAVLAQLRTGKRPLNGYLKTTHLLPNSGSAGTGNSLALPYGMPKMERRKPRPGPSDKWKPNMKAVATSISFALKTGRLKNGHITVAE